MKHKEFCFIKPTLHFKCYWDHAGEKIDIIFKRKLLDIKKTGKTIWLIRSPKASPPQIQKLCKNSQAYAIFIEQQQRVVHDQLRKRKGKGILC